TRSEALDAEVLTLMKRSGCTNFAYAPESGDEATLQRIKKKVDRDRMVASMRQAVRTGLNVKANFIFGFPDDTYRSIMNTFAFLVRIAGVGVYDIPIAALRPSPGSELFRALQESRGLPKELDGAHTSSPLP